MAHAPQPTNNGVEARTVSCPCCNGPSLYAASNPYRPFCSERCQKIDLGAWANEEFRVPTSPPLEPDSNPQGLQH